MAGDGRMEQIAADFVDDIMTCPPFRRPEIAANALHRAFADGHRAGTAHMRGRCDALERQLEFAGERMAAQDY
ncbi:MAG: hypothetical protein OXF74_13545 [Rhodobacteraceae bacterium]|nr:hypothetical protein [Paracoccaceae bacterium]